ncbi:MAG: prolipoprotein diacylglyceryl transferase, partial [Dehalococcoidia bacterium]|nr:prolipoprotein diacylglyceryl transferase [Dehalococcoidia bacterium]
MLWNLVLLAVFWRLRKTLRPDGLLFALYVGGYSAGRFLLTFVREEQIVAWGLQQAQIISLFGFVGSAALILYLMALRPKPQPAVVPKKKRA